MAIGVDRRKRDARREPEAMAEMARGAVRLREQWLALAAAFATVDASSAFVFAGASSLLDHALRLGYTRSDALLIAGLGAAITARPEIEERVRSGWMSVEAASVLANVLRRPELTEEWDAWLRHAEAVPAWKLRKDVRQRLAELDSVEPVVEISVHVPESTRDKFARAREIASRKASRVLTEGETFTVVLEHYLDSFDKARTTPRTRRCGPTAEIPDARYVPAEVERAVRARSGDRCEVPGCPNTIFRQLAHIVPHRDGSPREAEHLLDLCSTHHVLLDAGLLRLSPLPDGEWEFVAAEGLSLGRWSQGADASAAPPGCARNAPRPDHVSERRPRWERVPTALSVSGEAAMRVLRC